jgi:hypothetical protein
MCANREPIASSANGAARLQADSRGWDMRANRRADGQLRERRSARMQADLRGWDMRANRRVDGQLSEPRTARMQADLPTVGNANARQVRERSKSAAA